MGGGLSLSSLMSPGEKDFLHNPFDPGRRGRQRDQARDKSEAEREKTEAEADSYSLIQFQRNKQERAKGKRSTILTGPRGIQGY